MQVSNICNCNNFQYIKNKKQPTFQGHQEDFGKAMYDAFSKELAKSNVVVDVKGNLLSKFKDALDTLLLPQNIMGKGHHGTVYKVDDNFVMKITQNILEVAKNINKGIVFPARIFNGLETYYGEDIMRIGDIHFKKNLGKHFPAGVPIDMDFRQIDKFYQEEYLPKFSKVPQASYDAVVKDFAKLNRMTNEGSGYYEFDSYNPANIVLLGDKLCLVDEMNEANTPDRNTSAKLLELLLFHTRPAGVIPSYGEHINDAREIFHKIILASEKINLPYTSSSYDNSILQYTLEKCKSTVDSGELIADLVHIKIFHPILPERLKLVSEYLNKIMPLK